MPPSCKFTWLQLLLGYHPGTLEGVGQSSPCATSKGACGCAVSWGGRWPCPPDTVSPFRTLLWLGTQLARPLPAVGTGQSWAERAWGDGRSPAALRMGGNSCCLKENFWAAVWCYGSEKSIFPSLAPWRSQYQQGQRAVGQEVCLRVCRGLPHNWAGTTGASPGDGNRWDKSPACWCCCRKE